MLIKNLQGNRYFIQVFSTRGDGWYLKWHSIETTSCGPTKNVISIRLAFKTFLTLNDDVYVCQVQCQLLSIKSLLLNLCVFEGFFFLLLTT